VNVAAANAAGDHPEGYLPGPGPDERDLLDASFSGLVADFHESFHPHTPRVTSLSEVRLFKDIPDGGFGTYVFGRLFEKVPRLLRIYESNPSR